MGRLNALRERHMDWPMLGFAAISPGISLIAYCALWIAIGWEGGGFGAMLGVVAASFFASQDDPTPQMTKMLVATLISLALVAFYQFGVLPLVHDFGALVLVLSPAFLVLGLLIHDPKTMPYALPMTVNMATLLNLRSTYTGDFQSFVNSSVSIVLGGLLHRDDPAVPLGRCRTERAPAGAPGMDGDRRCGGRAWRAGP